MFDTQESMDSNHNIAARVRQLLDSKGVPKHRQVAAAGELLGLSASHAHRKMKGDSQWTLEQVKKIAKAFNVDPLTLIKDQIGDESHANREVSAQLKIGDTTVPCRAVLHNSPVVAGQDYDTVFFAEKRPPEWFIQYSTTPLLDTYPVSRINIECNDRRRPARVVAILEDNLETASELSTFLQNHNYETVAFQSIDELDAALKSNHFDAFILDWILDGTITAPAVELIRQQFGDDVPILILTGYAKNPVHLEQIAAAMLRYNVIGPYEKPIKGPLIKAALDVRFLHGASDVQEST
ncbi:helix-turn-helix domain-containing protein [Burkholderia gladioli]|uniref:helix-turn-helix domain-containing protein n=1 Tax=Burkholderia gladioli TaxID=28095 RepID=UPI0006186DFF|nr:helix-turn-helix domain-containing protein [Burkholderia gladioli]MBW5286515.1 response regulator [Burkholderia gladioli]